MKSQNRDKPETIVSQNDRNEQEPEYRFPAADFILVQDAPMHLWVDGIHFVEDADGIVQEGQHFLAKDPGMGVTVSMIEEVGDDDLAKVRHRYQWIDGELTAPESAESWTVGEITGEYDRMMGDVSESAFIRKVE